MEEISKWKQITKKQHEYLLFFALQWRLSALQVFAKKAYNRHQEEIRLQAIEIKNGEIDQEYENFEKEENRDKRLKVLKNEVKNAADYEKAENAYEECSAHYAKVIAQMKNYFVSDYDNTIKSISDKVGSDVEKVEDKDALSSASTDFTSFKETLKMIMKITILLKKINLMNTIVLLMNMLKIQ